MRASNVFQKLLNLLFFFSTTIEVAPTLLRQAVR